jgi:hypothetical protein
MYAAAPDPAARLASGADVGKTQKGGLGAFRGRLVKNGSRPKETRRLLKEAEMFDYVADYESDLVQRSDA